MSKDLTGDVSVEHTDHLVKKGAAGLAGVGFVVGLFAPPLLAATAIGAALGGCGGEALHRKTGSKIEEAAGETIPLGGAGLHRRVPTRGRRNDRAGGDACDQQGCR